MDEKIQMEDVANLEERSSDQITFPPFTPLALLLPPDPLDLLALLALMALVLLLSITAGPPWLGNTYCSRGGLLGTIRLIKTL